MTLTTAWPHRLLTLDDWKALPDDEGHRLECTDGMLIVTPKPLPRHQRAMVRLADALDRQLPAELTAVADVEVLIAKAPLTVRAPDVLVTSSSVFAAGPPRLAAMDVLLAVEILSEGSRRTDRVTKMSEYAEAGIAEYWIVDLDAAKPLSCHRIGPQGTYDLAGAHAGTVQIGACGIEVTLDVAHITAS